MIARRPKVLLSMSCTPTPAEPEPSAGGTGVAIPADVPVRRPPPDVRRVATGRPPTIKPLIPMPIAPRASRHQHRIDRRIDQLRIVERIVQPADILSVQRRSDYEVGGLEQIAQLDQVRRHAEMAVIILDLRPEQVDAVLRPLQPLGRPHDAD
ncbi:hypothetical protein LTR94_031978, partial [Friedmanniomyces endolithicus]